MKTGVAGPKFQSHSWALDFLSVYLALKKLRASQLQTLSTWIKAGF